MKKAFLIGLFMAITLLACRVTERILTTPKLSGPTSNPATANPIEFLTPEPITCANDSCLNACLERINTVLPPAEFNPVGGAYADADANFNLVFYDVHNGQLGEPQILSVPETYQVYQKDLATQKRIWHYASALLPPDQLEKWIDRFEIFTDGSYNKMAWVDFDKTDRKHWTLGIDFIDTGNSVDFTYTLVHELGHLITMNTDQIPFTEFSSGWYQNPTTCPQLNTPEGCTKPESYINQFYQQFWKPDFEEWRKTVERPHVNSPEEYDALVQKFYEGHTDQFVREYAATNIYEDLAESFMNFVLEPKSDSKSQVNQKIIFFYQFPEMVVLRKNMIQNLCSYVQR